MRCEDSGERLEIFRGDVTNNLTEAIVEPGPAWCRGQARLHLESSERYYNVGIGAVSEVSYVSALKRSALGLFPYLVGVFGAVAALWGWRMVR